MPNQQRPRAWNLSRWWILAAEIGKGRFQINHPETFISYKAVLQLLRKRKPHIFPGKRLQCEGLTELNEWTIDMPSVPKITGLVVDQKKHIPGPGYLPSHGFNNDSVGNKWWLEQTAKAIGFNWMPYLKWFRTIRKLCLNDGQFLKLTSPPDEKRKFYEVSWTSSLTQPSLQGEGFAVRHVFGNIRGGIGRMVVRKTENAQSLFLLLGGEGQDEGGR